MVTPDGHVGYVGGVNTSFFGKLCLGAVFVKTGHGEEAVVGNASGVHHGDEGVCVAGVAYDQDAYVSGGVGGDSLALTSEDFAVDVQQITTFHTCLARNGAYKHAPVGAFEAFCEVAGGNDFVDERECTVLEFHNNALKCVHGGFDFDQAKVDGLVCAQHGAGSDTEKERVGDLACCTCNCYSDRSFHI